MILPHEEVKVEEIDFELTEKTAETDFTIGNQMKSPIKEESKEAKLDLFPVKRVKEATLTKACGRICVKIND